MDSLRSAFDSHDTALDDEVVHDAPPAPVGGDERRMQVRAYNFWASLLDNRNFPHIDDLDPLSLPDFGPHGVLLDFSTGIENPAVAFLGEKLAQECGGDGAPIRMLSDVPARSLLSRITDHYMQILANQAPIGFEAEFVNQHGSTIMYRGILLPFSSDDETIDFIFGVINWKELADAQMADELLLEIDQALAAEAAPPRAAPEPLPMADWADGPAAAIAPAQPAYAARDHHGLPVPSFGLDDPDSFDQPASGAPVSAAMGLADWLAAARDQAMQARNNEDRTRGALYEAIGRAYDFALAAADAPDEFAELVADAGLPMQSRAPMTPVVKLVFGADYDKTRLAEYASALTHARRVGLGRGELAAYLARAEGGLKGVLAEERRLRREGSPASARRMADGPRKAIARRLRALPPAPLDAVPGEGAEFALILVRRTPEGTVALLGEVPQDIALIERAARKLTG
ncbi:PAS domain-containing protein [Alteraurantiacibacter palmitatis]|uniref:PAS domain-containing protein n=1 Tax=Alteraurantiacibacter palmitatis TaxID=2054628 RepID=A0ABV7E6S9_9SPHN